MKAMVYHGPTDVRYESKPDPTIEHPGDVILRVTRTAICGSDLHLYRGLVPDTRVGHTFGHEFAGVVEEVGRGVETVSKGDRLVVLTMRMGQCNTKRYMPHLLDHIREGRVDAKALISHRLPLSRVSDAYAMFAAKTDSRRKVVLTPD